ncbi:PAS domain S-box protein [Actinoallomurus purpureus]|uniref:PAS domain S-box protein n=1 Tax=Actinoallomurus purpureus TaxID=478114 RepID=UPI002093BB05|nr:PAS domain S-box protein [Actinoallomurus purpureus]MCO6007407.1 PAS domain S-box protein [Actinoallomurus purpureus]
MGPVGSSDAMMRAAVASSADAMIAVGADLTVRLWNPAAERTFGWSADEMLGRPLRIVPEEHTAEHRAVLERVREGGHISFLTRRLHRDGRLLDIRAVVSAMQDEDGEFLGWVGLYRPVREDEAVQHQTAERIRLVRRLNDVVADLNAALESPAVLDRVTSGLIELTGADAAGFVVIEHATNTLRLVSMTGLPPRLRDSTADLRASLVGELLRSGRTVMLATSDTRSLGDLIWSELEGLHTIAVGISNVQGSPYGALYALFSGRKAGHIELELLELFAGHAGVVLGNAMNYAEVVRQRRHERAVIEASADGIAVLDHDGVVQRWNLAAHQITGLATEDVIGRPLPFPLPAPGGEPTIQLESGTWLSVLHTEIEGHDEVVVDFRDVTEAKSLEEAKDLFLSMTSHELRTPITVVQGFAKTLVDRWEKLDDVDRRRAVATIADRADALGRLVDNLLYSRAVPDGLSVTSEPFDLAGLLRGAAYGFRGVSERHIVELRVADDLPPALGDSMATDIIVGQLLENAVKYSPDGGVITVRAEVADDVIAVTVEDDGIGIAADDRERVFERFVQGDAGDRRRFGGLGLGLYIVRRLARAQQGDVSAHPRADGLEGTSMRFTLPRFDDPA